MRLSRYSYLIREGFRSITTHGFMSFASVTIIMACLIIMGSFSLLSVNIDALIKDLENENEMVAYVDESIEDEAEAAALQSSIEAVPNVASAQFVSRTEAMDNFMSQYDSDFSVGIDEDVFRHRFVIQLSDIAIVAHVSSSYLSTRFKKETGMNFTEYLVRYRMNKAEELLKESNLRCREIAEQVGYFDYAHFSKIFKKYIGVSPREYQEKCRKAQTGC